MSPSPHLSDPELAEFVNGVADPTVVEGWLEHLEVCDQCESRCNRLERNSSTIQKRIRDAMATESVFDNEAGLKILTASMTAGLAVEKNRQQLLANNVPTEIGPYKVGRLIGCGGMGVVYEASHHWLGRTIALKLLRTDRGVDHHRLHQFTREFEAVGRLDHPNIVRAIDAGISHGRAFLVMELVDGLDLEKVRRRLGRLNEADVLEIAKQAARGLEHAHLSGVIHRDVKPSNLMLARRGPVGQVSVQVMDLGLSQVESAMTPDARLLERTVGTQGYRAPEQLSSLQSDGGQVDARADVYALGATMLALATDLNRLRFGDAQGRSAAGMTDRFEDLVSTMMATDRDDRPQSMQEVHDRLAALSDTTPEKSAVDLKARLDEAENWTGDSVAQDEATWSVLTDHSIAEQVRQSDNTTIGTTGKTRWKWFAAVMLVLMISFAVFAGLMSRKTSEPAAIDRSNQPAPPETEPLAEDRSFRIAREVVQRGGTLDLVNQRGESVQVASLAGFERHIESVGTVQLDWIMLHQIDVPDELLRRISQVDGVKGIVLAGTRVDDDDVIPLAGIETLESVFLYGTDVTDRSVEALSGLKNLRELVVSETKVTNAGIATLRGCKTLDRLAIKNSRCDGDCVADIATLSNLIELDLRQIDLVDSQLAPLVKLSRLRELQLARTDVTAAGIEVLRELPKIRHIHLGAYQIDELAAEKLMARKPGLILHIDPAE